MQEHKFSDNNLTEVANKKGFKVERIVHREKYNPYVYLLCKSNHRLGRTAPSLKYSNVTCHICNERTFNKTKAKDYINSKGFYFNGEPITRKDKYGNTVVKKSDRQNMYCSKGHKQRMNLSEMAEGKKCTVCSGSIVNTGFSRSEEIISGILTYNNIIHERQKMLKEYYNNVALDFYLPYHNIIIEYDGSQHVYGRSNETQEDLERTQYLDYLRDLYAENNSINIFRIDYRNEGRSLVYRVKYILENVSIYINELDTYYDSLIRRIYNESAKKFGWSTYEDIKKNADTYRYNSLSESSSITGYSQTVIARNFKCIYGQNKEDYLKLNI